MGYPEGRKEAETMTWFTCLVSYLLAPLIGVRVWLGLQWLHVPYVLLQLLQVLDQICVCLAL